jgi:hypothetical protein
MDGLRLSPCLPVPTGGLEATLQPDSAALDKAGIRRKRSWRWNRSFPPGSAEPLKPMPGIRNIVAVGRQGRRASPPWR